MVVTGVMESPVGAKEIIPVENGSLCVTVLQFCVELGARSGRQGAAGVQPEHLAVLGLRENHPARKALTAVRVFVGDATQAKEQSEKLILPAERSELIYLSIWLGRHWAACSNSGCAGRPRRNRKAPGRWRPWPCCVEGGEPAGG